MVGQKKARAMRDIQLESKKNSWPIYSHEIHFSRGFPKIMRGDHSYSGNADYFFNFADEFFRSVGL